MSTPQPIDYLHLFPPEIWLACWTLCSLQQLRRISLVCKLFRSLSLPFVFEHQTFDALALTGGIGRDNWIDRVRHLHRIAVRLDRLVQNPYAPMVRSWNVSFPKRPIGRFHPDIQNIHLFDKLYERILTTFSATLGLYHNLSSLHIYGLLIDAPFRATLTSLSKLDDLTLFDCDIVAQEGFLRLRSFTMISGFRNFWPENEGPFQIASPDSLCTLEIINLRDRQISLLLTGFGPGRLPCLVDLYIDLQNNNDAVALFQFLEQCPNLESLKINAPRTDFPGHYIWQIPDVSSETIPLLRILAGPPRLIQLLTLNRPVTGVMVLNWDDSDGLEPLCMDILRSARPIQSLALPAMTPTTLDTLVSIAHLFPDLRQWTIKIPQYAAMPPGSNSSFPFIPLSDDPLSVDAQSIDLCDDNAFDELAADDISDTESESPPMVIPSIEFPAPETSEVSGIHSILRWVFEGLLLLPPSIEVLRLEQEEGSMPAEVLFPQQGQAVATLGSMYPLLRQVRFGRDEWKRIGTSEEWKEQVESAVRPLHLEKFHGRLS
ncbi:hypothetical protein MVEN_01381000 [Mycena venus]|uniref:F-box domain-containing protein n=1 Tax=Mycena venus TaxID=2733690 RepID=A0A8H6XUW5_9AGAR|nr:hypothetical protein MVEN_01381000 [Mycena venus]